MSHFFVQTISGPSAAMDGGVAETGISARRHNGKMLQVLVSHPHAAAVATRAAAALDRHGCLAQYVTGIAAGDGSRGAQILRMVGQHHGAALNRVVAGVGVARVRSLWWSELAARGAGFVGPKATRGRRTYDALFVWHDAMLARLRWPHHVDAVYAYEDGALRTFRRARRTGLGTLWDSAAIHWQAAERIWREESGRWPGAMGLHPPLEPEWKKRRKDQELALADIVCVASRFAQGTLQDAGSRVPILRVPYGFPVESFCAKSSRPDGPFTVLAVGTHDLRKGTPYLLEAWHRAGLRGARLRLVGPMRLTKGFLARYGGLFEHVPYVPRSTIEREYQAADLLAFPTLGDGFGLAIQEAMCCGTPVVTTPCGGGPECVAHGEEGWIVPARSVDALVETLREAYADPSRVYQAGLAARRRAERWTWVDAGDELISSIGKALRSQPEGR